LLDVVLNHDGDHPTRAKESSTARGGGNPEVRYVVHFFFSPSSLARFLLSFQAGQKMQDYDAGFVTDDLSFGFL
jgi:hypothetical protein